MPIHSDTRYFSRWTILAAMLVALTCPASLHARRGRPLRIGNQTQLLIDDYIVQEQHGFRTLQNQPSSGQIVLANDKPWEQRIFYPDVLRVGPHEYRMYYDVGLADDPSKNDVALAVSTDGLHFSKPTLPNVRIDGNPTNIVLRDAHGPAVVRRVDSDRNSFEIGYGMPGGMGLAASVDGLGFTPDAGNPVIANKADTKQSILWDAGLHRWLWFSRFWEKPTDGRPGWTHFQGEIRSVARFESPDLQHWSPAEVVIRRAPGDPLLSDLYGLQVTARHGILIGLLWTSDWDDLRGLVGRQRAVLVTSRDHGHTWARGKSEQPFFQLGQPASFDSQVVWPTTILTRGKQDLIYYQASRIEHAVVPVAEFPADAYRLGVRSIGYDRFVARTAFRRGGTLITRSFALPDHRRLLINAKTSRGGYIKLLLVKADSQEVLARSATLHGDLSDASVRWERLSKGHPRFGQSVQLKFVARNASLYAFTFSSK